MQFPTAMIPKSLQRHLFAESDGAGDAKDQGKRLEVDRYEFLVYRLLRNALEAGDLFVKDSNEFRRFEDDLISDTRWEQHETVLQEIGAPLLIAPIEDTLSTFREAMETRFAQVNQRITNSANKHIKITGRAEKRRWKLIYPTAEEPVSGSFYSQLPGTGIADLLRFVAGVTGFLGAFTHVLDRYVKHAPDAREILACVVALGTNMGLWKMAEVSGLSFSSLQGTARNYLRQKLCGPRMMPSPMPSRPCRHFICTTSVTRCIPAAMGSASKHRSTPSTPDTRRSISDCRRA